MKITKKRLKEIIKEEIQNININEAFSKKKVDTKIIAKRMMKDKHYRMWFGPKWAQAILKKYRKGVSEADIDRDMPEYVPGALISDLFDGLNEGKLTEQKLRKVVRESIKKIMEAKIVRFEIPMKDKKKVQSIVKKLRLKDGKDYSIYGSGKTFEMELDVKHANKVLELLMKMNIKVRG